MAPDIKRWLLAGVVFAALGCARRAPATSTSPSPPNRAFYYWRTTLHFSDVEKIIIAGGFGQYIDVEKAMTIGLLPEVDPKIVSYGGNTSLEGCRMASLFRDKIGEAEAIASMITNIELSTSALYMDEYVAALFLPHTRVEEFPLRMKRLEALRSAIPAQRQ